MNTYYDIDKASLRIITTKNTVDNNNNNNNDNNTIIRHQYNIILYNKYYYKAYYTTYIRQYGQFSKFHVCFCGLDPGNLKSETVRTNKQHICF